MKIITRWVVVRVNDGNVLPLSYQTEEAARRTIKKEEEDYAVVKLEGIYK